MSSLLSKRHTDMTRLVVVVDGFVDAGLPFLDALARLQLAACRCGAAMRVYGATAELEQVLALAGLSDVVPCSQTSDVEVIRQPEVGEELRVDEVVHVRDPTA